MAWIRVDDHFDEHPKMAKVGPLGIALWLVGLAYCNRNLTDGFIPWAIAESLLTWEFLGEPEEDGRRKQFTIGVSCGMSGEDVNCQYVIPLLLNAGLWEQVDGGYYVHDYPKYQFTKAEIEEMRETKRRAGQAGGLASALARAQPTAKASAAAKRQQVLKQNGSPNPNPNNRKSERPSCIGEV